MQQENPTAETWLAAQRQDMLSGESVEIDVFVRSLSPSLGARERQEELFKQLGDLQTAGIIETHRVNLWGGGVCLCDVCSGTSVAESMLNRVEEFEGWADRFDAITLPFQRRSVESGVVDRTSDDLVVPSLSLAVYVDDELQSVFPCSIDGESVSVTEFVEAVAAESDVDCGSVETRDPIAQI